MVHNISDVEVTITLGDELKDFNKVDFDSRSSVSLRDGELTLQAYSSIVLK